MRILSPITFLYGLFLFFISTLLYTGKFKIDNHWLFKLDIVDGKVIHPQCFSTFAYEEFPYNSIVYVELDTLVNCERFHKNELELSQNFLSSEYPRTKYGTYGGYAGYEIAGKFDDGSYIIDLTENGGGTGHFTSIWKLSKSYNWSTYTGKLGNNIKIEYMGGRGDRCNGGTITNKVSRDKKGEYFETSSFITTFMFFNENKPSMGLYYIDAIIKDKLLETKNKYTFNLLPYKELENCAICCAGNKITKRYLNGSIETIYELHNKNRGVSPESELSSSGKYQECFNNIVIDKIDETGHKKFIRLNEKEINDLRKKFYQDCIQPELDKEAEKNNLKKLILSYDDKKLCDAALSTQHKNQWDYTSFYSTFAIHTAQTKQLNCGIDLFLGKFNHSHICDKATTIDYKWTNDKDLSEFVNEAKRLNLDCKKVLTQF